MRIPDKLFSRELRSLSSLHVKLSRLYEVWYHANDLAAGLFFVIGSVLFFWKVTKDAGTWFFLLGSVLFVMRPTIHLVRDLHLMRLRERDEDAPGVGSGLARSHQTLAGHGGRLGGSHAGGKRRRDDGASAGS